MRNGMPTADCRTRRNEIFFVTGNVRKFEELAAVIPGLRQITWDLPEIQEIDPQAIIRAKLGEAVRLLESDSNYRVGSPARLIVEDTSLYFDCLQGQLPGPLVKWFLQAIGNEGLHGLCAGYGRGDFRAVTRSVIGCRNLGSGRTSFHSASLAGKIVPPRGDMDFGWGPIFQPTGYDQTFGEMDRAVKESLSMRAAAARELNEFLDQRAP